MTEQNSTGSELKPLDGQLYTYGEHMTSAWPRYKDVQVRKAVEGTLVQEIKAVRKVYRRSGRKVDKGSTTLSCRTDEQAIREFMTDYGVTPDLISRTLAKWTELVSTMPLRGNGRLYKWIRTEDRGTVKPMSRRKLDEVTLTEHVPVQWTFELRSILALISAMVYTMPEPVQVIRNIAIHGDDGQPSSEPMVYFDFQDDAVEAYTRFVVAIVTPYAVRKISMYERTITGRVYERALYRTTDMGQGGRRFSDADVSDILSRTILAAFFPLYCRTLPLTDKGKAYVMVKDCTLISRKVGKKMYKRQSVVASLHKLDKNTRLFRKGKMTEQEYSEFLSKFTIPPVGKRSVIRDQEENGYWLVYKCNQTGQLFTVFTQSAQRAEQLSIITTFCGEVDKVIPVNKSEMTELDADSVYNWSVDGAFFRSLKGMTRNLYRFLMRRTNHADLLITEHNESRRLRRNAEHLFSLQEVKDTVQELSDVQKDVIEAELSLEIVPPNVHRLSRKVWLYNRAVEQRTGINPKMSVRAYRDLRDVTFHCIAVQLGLVEEPIQQAEHEYTEEELDSVVYRIPLWMTERADRGQLSSFETAFAVQSGVDKSTVSWPKHNWADHVSRLPYFVYDNKHGMMYIRPGDTLATYDRFMEGGQGHSEPEQLTPVQYPVLSRPMARHMSAVRALSGRSERHLAVNLDTMTVNGFTVPVWTTEQETYVPFMPEVYTFTSGEWFDEMYGVTMPCGKKVLVDKDTPVQTFMRKIAVPAYYIDVFTANGDGI